jgi:hypothetical protein
MLNSNASKLQVFLMSTALAVDIALAVTGQREWALWLSVCIVAVGVLLR